MRVRIFEKNSTALAPEEIGGRYRFFHIDGGHTCEEAWSDLRLAAACIRDEGLIALDDPFKPEWPGVTEGLLRFLDENPVFGGVVMGFNKLILAKKKHAQLYLREVAREAQRRAYGLGYPWHVKEVSLRDEPLVVFYIPSHLRGRGLASRLLRR